MNQIPHPEGATYKKTDAPGNEEATILKRRILEMSSSTGILY
jgi:hypothetical protein